MSIASRKADCARDGHVYYTKDDFTQEEIDRRNVIAVAVIEDGYSICKKCGGMGPRNEQS